MVFNRLLLLSLLFVVFGSGVVFGEEVFDDSCPVNKLWCLTASDGSCSPGSSYCSSGHLVTCSHGCEFSNGACVPINVNHGLTIVTMYADECSGSDVRQCSDGHDNDGDGKKDFGFDPGCSNLFDNDESDIIVPLPSCPIGTIGSSSFGCYNPELSSTPPNVVSAPFGVFSCDFQLTCGFCKANFLKTDAGCAPASSFCSAPFILPIYGATACDDGIDNDRDGLIDESDSGCLDVNGAYQSSYDSELKKCYSGPSICSQAGNLVYTYQSYCSSSGLCDEHRSTISCSVSNSQCQLPGCSNGACIVINRNENTPCTDFGVVACYNSTHIYNNSGKCNGLGSCVKSVSSCGSGKVCVFDEALQNASCQPIPPPCLKQGACNLQLSNLQNNICIDYYCARSGSGVSDGQICPNGTIWNPGSGGCQQPDYCSTDPCNTPSLGGYFSVGYYSASECFRPSFNFSCCSIFSGKVDSRWLRYRIRDR